MNSTTHGLRWANSHVSNKNFLKGLLTFILLFIWGVSTAQLNKALVLNGTSDYVEVPNHSALNLSENQTVEVWVRPDTSNSMVILRKGWCNNSNDQYYVGINRGKVVWVWATNGNCDFNSQVESQDSVVQTGICTHIAVVHLADTVRIFVNGRKVKSSLVKGSYSRIRTGQSSLTVGSYRWKGGGYGAYFKGKIDEVRIWKVVRSDIEIDQYKNLAISSGDSNLVMNLTMEDSVNGAGQSVANISFLGTAIDGNTIGTSSSPVTDSSLCVNYDPTSLVNEIRLEALNVYPNPSTGVFNLIDLGENNGFTIDVFDIVGRKAYSEIVRRPTGVLQVDLSDLVSGQYQLIMTGSNVIKRAKIIIE